MFQVALRKGMKGRKNSQHNVYAALNLYRNSRERKERGNDKTITHNAGNIYQSDTDDPLYISCLYDVCWSQEYLIR